MPSNWIFLIELFVLKGAILAFAVRELVLLKRDERARDASEQAQEDAGAPSPSTADRAG